MNEESIPKEERKRQAVPYALYLKQQGKLDHSIVEEISSSFNLSFEESKEILQSIKNSFPEEIKKASKSNILYLIPFFLFFTFLFIGWIVLSIGETWFFFIGGLYGIFFGLISLGTGFSIDRMLKENYPKLRLRLRIGLVVLLLSIIIVYPSYRLISKKYILDNSDLIRFDNMPLAKSLELEYDNHRVVALKFNFAYYSYETFDSRGSEMDALNYSALLKLNLKDKDSVDIFLMKDKSTGGYYKSFFSKRIHIYNIKKNNTTFVDLEKRNSFEKVKFQNTLWNCCLFSIPLFLALYRQTKRLANFSDS